MVLDHTLNYKYYNDVSYNMLLILFINSIYNLLTDTKCNKVIVIQLIHL